MAISIRIPDTRNLIYFCENAWSYLQISCATGQRTDACRSAAPAPLLQEDAVILRMQNWLVFLRVVDQMAIDYAPTAAALDQRLKPEADSQSK